MKCRRQVLLALCGVLVTVLIVNAHDLADDDSDTKFPDSPASPGVVTLDGDTFVTVEHDDDLDENVFDFSRPASLTLAPAAKKSVSSPQSRNDGGVSDFKSIYERYSLEVVVAIAAIIVAAQLYIGKEKNYAIAHAWMEQAANIFDAQFAHIGVGRDEKSYMVSRGWDVFEFYATGRVNCKGCHVDLELISRQCPWSYISAEFLFPERDVMTLEIPLLQLERFSFAIGRRVELKSLQNISTYLKDACSIRRVPDLPPTLCVISDNAEVVEKLLAAPEVVQVLTSSESLIRSIIICDAISSARNPNEKCIIRAQLTLPTLENMSKIRPLLQLIVCYLIDAASALRLSDKAKAEVKKARHVVEKKILQETVNDKAEERYAKRVLKKKEEEDRLENMTESQKRKWEDKQHKKSLKHRGPKIKVMSA